MPFITRSQDTIDKIPGRDNRTITLYAWMVKEIAYDLNELQSKRITERENVKSINALEKKNAFKDNIIDEQKFQISELLRIIDLKEPEPFLVKAWKALRWVLVGFAIGVGVSL